MKIPCIKCDSKLWKYIKPYLDKWGYNIQWITPYQLDSNSYLVINRCDILGDCGNFETPGEETYNRESITNVEEFLERAAKLKGFVYERKDIMRINGIEIKAGMVIILNEANAENVPYIVFPRTDNLAVVKFKNDNWGSWCLLKDFINRNYNNITRIHDVAGGEQSLLGDTIWEKSPEEIVLTMDEIAKKFGYPVEQIKIRK